MHGGIIGEAKIKILDVLTVEEAIKKYVSRGVIESEKELKVMHSHGGKVSVYLLTHVKKYPRKLSLSELRNIIPGVNTSIQNVTDDQINSIRKVVGTNLNSY